MEYYAEESKQERRSFFLELLPMDGTAEHYAKGNNSDNERQIPYDLTYKWNLINRINRQAKYNLRH